MPRLTVRHVTAYNWLDALALDVYAEQRTFTASVERSLARAYIQPHNYIHEPMAIYVATSIVGFYCLVYRAGDASHCFLTSFFIDKTHQGRGYGRTFLQYFLASLRRQDPRYQEVRLTVHPENRVALHLYTSFGFTETGQMMDGEAEMQLRLS